MRKSRRLLPRQLLPPLRLLLLHLLPVLPHPQPALRPHLGRRPLPAAPHPRPLLRQSPTRSEIEGAFAPSASLRRDRDRRPCCSLLAWAIPVRATRPTGTTSVSWRWKRSRVAMTSA